MSTSNSDRQRTFRERRALRNDDVVRYVTKIWSIALEIKEELVSLRNALRNGLEGASNDVETNFMEIKDNLASLRNDFDTAVKQQKVSPLDPPQLFPPAPPSLTPPIIPPSKNLSDSGFDRWWEGYPEKTGKGAAKRAFVKALTKTSIDQLMVGVERYKATKPVDRPWCHPATWLNQERWLDVPASTSAATGDLSFHAGPNGPAPTLEELRLSMERPH
jgi:hypothetical protein